MQSQAGILKGTTDERASLRAVAAQRVIWAKVRQAPKLTARALKALQKQDTGMLRNDSGARWLLEDAEAILAQIDQMKSIRLRLPILRKGMFRGLPRIHALMMLCAMQCHGQVTEQAILHTLNAYQVYADLSITEIWHAPRFMYRVLLDLAADHALYRIDRIKAYAGARKAARILLTKAEPDIRFLAMDRGIGFAAELQRTLCKTPSLFLRYSIMAASALGMDACTVNRLDRLESLKRGSEIKNILTSLRRLQCFSTPFELLHTHPALARLSQQKEYRHLDNDGKNRMIESVMRTAKRSGMSEQKVVNEAIRMSGKDGSGDGILKYLWEDTAGSAKAFGFRRMDTRKLAQRMNFYLLWIAVPLLMLLYVVIAVLNRALFMEILGGTIFGWILLYTAIHSLLEWLYNKFIPPKALPRFENIPDDASTAVVMPVMAETKEQMDRFFQRLQAQAQAFCEAAQFVLLCDFPPSGAKENSLHAALLDYGQKLAEKLNGSGNGRFLFVTRPQIYVKKERKWMGFDGKRGALNVFNAALLGRQTGIEVYGGVLLKEIRYVLVLNEESFYPPGHAKRLVCALSHPYNRQYAVLQPALATFPATLAHSALARLYADSGRSGFKSDVEMNVFGQGIYTGEGLYDIRRFTKAVKGLPEGRLLLPHAIEGALANCAYVFDARVLQSFPTRHSSYIKREHRRVRGIWQQSLLLFGSMDKEKGRSGLSVHQKVLIIERMMHTLATLSTTQLLAIATFSILPFGFYVTVALLPYIIRIPSILAAFVTRIFANSYTRRIMKQRSRSPLRKAASDFVLCPFDAAIALDAAVRALYRTFISKRNLMEWITKGQAEQGDALSLVGYLWHMIPALLFNLLMVAFTLINKPGHAFGIALIAFLWFLSPVIAWHLDKRPKDWELLYPAFWVKLCKQTYDYFTALSEHFPLPPKAVLKGAQRTAVQTTPSDLACTLLSHVCAYELRFIGPIEAAARMARALDLIAALPKWQGHPGGAIDPYAKEPPRNIRIIESANLCLALMVTEQALDALGESGQAARAASLWQAMDFMPLFDGKKHVFADSTETATGRLDFEILPGFCCSQRAYSFFAARCAQTHWQGFTTYDRDDCQYCRKPKRRREPPDLLWPRLFPLPWPCVWEQATARGVSAAHRNPGRLIVKGKAPHKENSPIALQNDTEALGRFRLRTATPYAFALMAPFDEAFSYEALRGFEQAGMRCVFGFWEYSGRERKSPRIVMLHQGMILCTLTNLLTNGTLEKLAAKTAYIATLLPYCQ